MFIFAYLGIMPKRKIIKLKWQKGIGKKMTTKQINNWIEEGKKMPTSDTNFEE